MILSIDDLRKYDFQLSGINIIYQKPKYRKLIIKKRKINGFMMIMHGECQYRFRGGEIRLSPGSVLYLPLGSAHTMDVLSEEVAFYRIDFKLTVNGELVHFSNHPLKLYHTAPKACVEAVRELYDSCQFVEDSIRKTELLCAVFRTLTAGVGNQRRDRLAPAIRYLLENLTGDIDCSCLAQTCNLSSAQFYNLFRAEYQMTPLEYRNKLLIQKAVLLLQDGMLSVGEVAGILGFENASYFSRFFKKYQGVSPSKFCQDQEIINE